MAPLVARDPPPAKAAPPHHRIHPNTTTLPKAAGQRRMSAPGICSVPFLCSASVAMGGTSEAGAPPPPHGPSPPPSFTGAVVVPFPSPRLAERPSTARAASHPFSQSLPPSGSNNDTAASGAPPASSAYSSSSASNSASNSASASALTSPSPGSPISPPPRCISWAEISELRYLGAGEFCTVWGATLDAGEVAVKVLKEEHNNNQLALDDLQRETQIMMGLSHPGILRVRGVGETEGKPFLVLDRSYLV